MRTQLKTITIAISVVLQDAGEATRSLEIAKGLRDMAPQGVTLDIVFLTHGSKFEPLILENGFRLQSVAPALNGVGPNSDLKMGNNNFIGSAELAYEFLIGEQQAYQELHPDVVLHGFWPFASIARRMSDNVIPGICFLPIPMEPSLYCKDLMKDVPDIMRPLTYLPRFLRHFIVSHIPTSVKLKVPIMRQENILQALKNSDWKGEPIHNLFDMLKADLTVVNDIEVFYQNMDIPSNFKITGPLYAKGGSDLSIDPEITRIFARTGQDLNIFCTMGSSGNKKLLLEAIRAISQFNENWHAVVLAPPAICPLEDAKKAAMGNKNIYITDQFVPAPKVNELADIVISHGGQGTVQTAIASQTPIIGVALQPEQQINLDNVVLQGGAIRIPLHRFHSRRIHAMIRKMSGTDTYQKNMKKLQKYLFSSDGKQKAASAIWRFILDQKESIQ